MIDLSDYITKPNGKGTVKHYRCKCSRCGTDRGYLRKRLANKQCRACAKHTSVPDNVNTSDFITKRTARLYKTTCLVCGENRGYQLLSNSNKSCHSCAMVDKWHNGTMDNIQYANRTFKYSEHVFKSSYELAYAKYLDSLNIAWEYEPKYKLSNGRIYLPDFKLKHSDKIEIVEIKGYWRDDAKAKWDRFCKDYPDLNKRVLMKEDLEKISII